MSKKPNRTGSGGPEARHIRLHHWMTNSPAWHDLNAVARAIYCEIAKRYNGSNNGEISYSVREAVDELRISGMTAWRAIKSLVDHGFNVEIQKGAFSLKKKHATVWRLTEFPCDVTHSIASKDFMRWTPGQPEPKPSHKKQNAVTPEGLTVTPEIPNGYPRDTVSAKNSPDGYPRDTVEANFDVSRLPQRDTYKLPGTGEQPEHGIGHNLGPPLDGDLNAPRWTTPVLIKLDWNDDWARLYREPVGDLTIPSFLRRDLPVASVGVC
jgi:hypothetical protein